MGKAPSGQSPQSGHAWASRIRDLTPRVELLKDDAERGRAAITTAFRTDQAPAEKIARDLLDWAALFDRTLSAARHGRVCDAHGMVKLAELRLPVRVPGSGDH